MKIGDMVMIRDTWIEEDYHIPPAKIVEIKINKFDNLYLLEFDNGIQEWFLEGTLKTQ